MGLLVIVGSMICLFGMTTWADSALPPATQLPFTWHWDGEPRQMRGRRFVLYFVPVVALGSSFVVAFCLAMLFGPWRWPVLWLPPVIYVLAQLFSIFRLWRWFRRGMKQGWYAAPGGLNRPHG